MKTFLSASVGVLLALCSPLPASAQAPPTDPNAPPPMLIITREEVKAGMGAAHTANEVGWAAMMAKAQWPTGWLGTTSVTGPSEAWYFTPFASYAAYDKDRLAQDAAPALSDTSKFQAQDGAMVSRTSTLVAMYRPSLSYQPSVILPKMRYFSIDTVVVKPGHTGDFIERWVDIVAAHSKAKLDEHWAVYEITSGGQSGTYLFVYALDSLATLDESGAKHSAADYRDAMGEGGRAKSNAMSREAVEWQQNRIFAFSPKMSYLTKAFTDVDPTFWTPVPPAAPALAAKAKK